MAVLDDGQGNCDAIDPVVRVMVDNGFHEYELELRHGASIRLEEVV